MVGACREVEYPLDISRQKEAMNLVWIAIANSFPYFSVGLHKICSVVGPHQQRLVPSSNKPPESFSERICVQAVYDFDVYGPN